MFVLIVSDNQATAMTLRQALSQHGYECPMTNVVSIEGGRETIDSVQPKPNLILFVLPTEAERSESMIRLFRESAETRLIAVGPRDPKRIRAAIRAGANDYLDESSIWPEDVAEPLHGEPQPVDSRGEMSGIPSVVSEGELCGRSVLAANLAMLLAEEHGSAPPGEAALPEVAAKTRGEIEAAICDGITRFEQEYMGRGPKDLRTYLIRDLLVVHLQGVLTAAEQHLVTTLAAEKGRDLVKQVRSQLIETARPLLEAMVQSVTGIKTVSLHHDISTATGEEIVVFRLADRPLSREMKSKKEL